MSAYQTISIGEGEVSAAQLAAIAEARASLVLPEAVRQRLEDNAAQLREHLERGHGVYGVTTGFGSACDTDVATEDRRLLADNLVKFHGCGVGRVLDRVEARAVIGARLTCLARGHSGVRAAVVEGLLALLEHDIVPEIPAQGSVGASGDLTPLSYVAAVLLGRRRVLTSAGSEDAATALHRAGLAPLTLGPKESLALMNGTSVMTGLACLAVERALRLLRWASALSAMCCEAIEGNPSHFDPRLFALKPHPGQSLCARWIWKDLGSSSGTNTPVQDRYSLRCAPHVLGMALDTLSFATQWIETELNSVNDNPVLVAGEVLHGGHFYGGHVCQAMDALKTACANVADLLDRQLALCCNPVTNRGLPDNLVVGGTAHHGFKAMQIAASALAAETAKASMPASVFSRSTENHNQDKVSLGTIAARDCLKILTDCEHLLGICSVAFCHALELRGSDRGPRAASMLEAVRKHVPRFSGDRPLARDIEAVVTLHRQRQLPVGEAYLPASRGQR